jgi:Animal haem peroxidase
MRSNVSRIPFARRSPPPPAGYTYAGQFILHDLTRDDTTLGHAAAQSAANTVNRNPPRLDLSSLYGAGPFSQDRHLYEEDGVLLKLGTVRTKSGARFDLPLDLETSRPLLADSRNNENLVLRQIHATFLKLHNRAVDQLRPEVSESKLFEEASRRVRWQFQWLVRFDYLPRICKPNVYREVVLEGHRQIDWPPDRFSLPIEFSHAAARFGHSMVRFKYDLNHDHLDVALAEMIRQVHKPGALQPSSAVDWRKFFTNREPANSIDTTMAEPMFELPAEALRRFGPWVSEDNPAELAVRTLRRGAALKLATGQEVRAVLAHNSSISNLRREFPQYEPLKVLVDLGLEEQTPLWYYILLEAEVNERGARLGEVGSRLIAEVIEAALAADSASIVQQLKGNPKWRPPAWKTASGEFLNIDSFLELGRDRSC